ncbi:Gfo/Idh/MocA family protein [Streptomyces albireticuli]|uniref:Gfo/Idh/MocA family protein n=1 Tax=Streptomyces albireticuli TaxID=1940 RepID=UPI001E3465A7|nr:Gfo/Idh/MocA family oxidoreductase [Streptomyces albireticuli]MCD9143004.1 Gfo/Idh/MocA family oxidoreductase [Streptomyces albireticuli]MCD9165247.1 Gfo/Idh/MocA family oxidoreductase [Streptomyces albireticuli]MCD9192236.1 Gfo/Idh/MocA family oxidoreductase [Streptomyces albireticuli]
MEAKKIRVGIIGANAERGWALRAHLPALRSLADFEISAVGTRSAESARAAAHVFGAAHAFGDARQLAEHPDVDVVVLTVKVPAHAELVRTALAAGKHVYCEWPLARTTEEAEELAEAARGAGVHHTIGLQARYAPAIGRARELIADGYVGRVTSATVYSALGMGAAGQVPAWAAYILDRRNGAGILEVAGGHTLDALQYVLGDFAELSAGLSVRTPVRTVAETGAAVEVTSPDHLLLNGTLADGAVVSAHIHGAKVSEARTRVEISGTRGDLALVSAGPNGAAGIQIGELRLLGSHVVDSAQREMPVPRRHRWAAGMPLGAEGFNVAQMYGRIASDLRTGARTTPGFEEGVRVHRLLDAIRVSAGTGVRRGVG